MSLINEALKKAQKLRNESAGSGQAASDTVAKRPQPRSANSTIILAAGAFLIVILTMVLTALWFTKPAASAPVADSRKQVAPSAPEPVRDTPSLVVPSITLPASTVAAPAAATPAPATTTEATAPAAPAPVVAKVEPQAESTPTPAAATPVPAPQPPSEAKPDERIQQYVDALKVAGIRSSGTESKVLMNDRVFRVNDIVDRALGVKLIKVSPDSLTFTDANGAEYVKRF